MGEDELKGHEGTVRTPVVARISIPVQIRRPGTDIADQDTVSREKALALARRAADRVAAMAPTAGNRMSWLGLGFGGVDRWQVTPVGQDLYSGMAGIALFLAQLAKVTGEEKYAAPAVRALRSLHMYLDELLDGPTTRRPRPGAFSGEAGIAYALAATSALLGEPALAVPVGALLRALTGVVEADAELGADVKNGAAGCLAVAEALAPRFAEASDLASACARALIEKTGERPVSGFSPGAAGIAWALVRHAARTGDEKARSTAWSVFAEERAAFSPMTVDDTHRMHVWCRGAPGIGLARAGIDAALRTPDLDDDLRSALESTMAFGLFGNHSLCHGDLGNLELFTIAVEAGHSAGRAHIADERTSRISRILDDITERGLICGTPAGLPTPGLMTGLAGIGHGLLRIAAPDTVASVLLLQEQR
jgi:lantibiotic modifying enzyme